MGKASIPSMELERSMNMQGRIMTVEETLRHSAVIDELDDKRRERLHNIVQWCKDMQKNFIKELNKILACNEENIKLSVSELLDKQINFFNQFNKSIDEVLRQEAELEKIDDRNRTYLISYTAKCREDLRNENSEIEKAIILRKVKND